MAQLLKWRWDVILACLHCCVGCECLEQIVRLRIVHVNLTLNLTRCNSKTLV